MRRSMSGMRLMSGETRLSWSVTSIRLDCCLDSWCRIICFLYLREKNCDRASGSCSFILVNLGLRPSFIHVSVNLMTFLLSSITYHGHCQHFITPVILTYLLTFNVLIVNTKKKYCHFFISPVTPTHFFTISVLIAKKIFLFSTLCPTYCLTHYCNDSCPVCTYFTSTEDDI